MKFNVLTCDKSVFNDGKVMFKIIGTLEGEEIENNSQVMKFYSSTSAVPQEDYEVKLKVSNDMKSIKPVLGKQIFKK